ncbi:hypothetical protein QL285_038801 [Trifolium repens]|nr:hypothetical protein QL285_038801 [Trifolium repens]
MIKSNLNKLKNQRKENIYVLNSRGKNNDKKKSKIQGRSRHLRNKRSIIESLFLSSKDIQQSEMGIESIDKRVTDSIDKRVTFKSHNHGQQPYRL